MPIGKSKTETLPTTSYDFMAVALWAFLQTHPDSLALRLMLALTTALPIAQQEICSKINVFFCLMIRRAGLEPLADCLVNRLPSLYFTFSATKQRMWKELDKTFPSHYRDSTDFSARCKWTLEAGLSKTVLTSGPQHVHKAITDKIYPSFLQGNLAAYRHCCQSLTMNSRHKVSPLLSVAQGRPSYLLDVHVMDKACSQTPPVPSSGRALQCYLLMPKLCQGSEEATQHTGFNGRATIDEQLRNRPLFAQYNTSQL